MSDDRPAVHVGDLVIVLEWIHLSAHTPAPYCGVVYRYDALTRTPLVLRPPYVTMSATRWRLPTPEELAAYQLDQLQAGGL